MTFEKQFPSLSKYPAQNYKCINGHYTYCTKAIKKNCLDKQKIKDAYFELKRNMSPHSHGCVIIPKEEIEAFEKAAGLK